MGKRAVRRSDSQHVSKPSPAIVIIGAQPEDDLGLALTKAFNGAHFFPHQDTPNLKPDLAVGVCEGRDRRALQGFYRWAHDADVPSLCVDVWGSAALIGPLALPNRAGCGRCAFERLSAATATKEPDSQPNQLPLDVLTKIATPSLIREIQAIIRDGPERSQLLDHILAIDGETLDESLHKIIPLHRCQVCGGASAFPLLNQESIQLTANDSIEQVLSALAGWVDQRTGVISDLYLEPPDELGISLPIIATAAPPHLMEDDGSLRQLPLGWGKGLTISGAVLSAVGEAIERYAASLLDPERIVWARPHDLEGEFIDPRACGLYTDQQYDRDDFPYVRFDESVRHPWVRGNWLSGGGPVWVPTVSVFLSVDVHLENLICQGTSNGLAASTNEDDAALRATLELVERDAFMAAWLSATSGQRVQLDDTLDPLLRSVLEGIESLGAQVEVYVLPTSVIGTTVLCLALGDGDQYPGVTFGLGSDLDAHSAMRQAILELGQTGPYLRRMMRSKALPIPEDPRSVREMLDHAAYYFPRERATAFNSLRSDRATVALRDLESSADRSLNSCASELDAAGVRVALVNVTSADVARGPFSVVRAVSTDLQTIWYGYGLERLPVERVRRMGVATDIPPINPIW